MPNPQVPNFNPGVGRLATDRFDFQNHVDGYAFRHEAASIDLTPPVLITTPSNNVRDAIIQLKNALTVPIVPDATTVSKGVIQLIGDIGGTATSVSVIAIRGFPVAATPPTLNYVLTWNGSAWAPGPISGSFSFAGDVTGTASATTVVKINGKPVSAAAPGSGDVLFWNGTTWTPTHITPTGTGFAHVTSGSFDTAATANVRYTGGKFQTDANIQFKNTSILGDLAWTPTSSNKTLTLPDITDVIVTRTNTESLTNKTINATLNTITDTSTTTGDILVSNGTKFLKRVQGANGTFWGVSGGVAGYYAIGGVPGIGSNSQVIRTTTGAVVWSNHDLPSITNTVTGIQNNVGTSDGNSNPIGVINFAASDQGDSELTGLSGGFDGRMLTLMNFVGGEGGSGLILYHEDGGSASNNQFSLPNNDTYTIPDDSACIVQYDGVASKWRIVGEPVSNVVFPTTYNSLTINSLNTSGISVSSVDSNSGIFWNELTTTTTSPTVLNAYVTMPQDGVIRVEATVTMTRRTDATKAGIYKRVACFRRVDGGTATAVGTVVTPYADQETTAGDDVTIVGVGVNSADIKVQVTAADTDERLWWIKYEYMLVDAV